MPAYIFQKIDDVKMLRADALALSAFDTVRRLSVSLRNLLIIGKVHGPSLFRKVFAHILIV